VSADGEYVPRYVPRHAAPTEELDIEQLRISWSHWARGHWQAHHLSLSGQEVDAALIELGVDVDKVRHGPPVDLAQMMVSYWAELSSSDRIRIDLIRVVDTRAATPRHARQLQRWRLPDWRADG
jgi:hypothetical protein